MHFAEEAVELLVDYWICLIVGCMLPQWPHLTVMRSSFVWLAVCDYGFRLGS